MPKHTRGLEKNGPLWGALNGLHVFERGFYLEADEDSFLPPSEQSSWKTHKFAAALAKELAPELLEYYGKQNSVQKKKTRIIPLP